MASGANPGAAGLAGREPGIPGCAGAVSGGVGWRVGAASIWPGRGTGGFGREVGNVADNWAGFGKPPGRENPGTGGFGLPPGTAGLAAAEPAGAELAGEDGRGRDALPGTGGFARGGGICAEPVEFGAMVGIMPVVEGGTGVPGVGNWRTAVSAGRFPTGTAGFSGTTGVVPRTRGRWTPATCGPAALTA